MSNYSNTKATIATNIYTNGNNEITAVKAKAAVDAVVDTLIAGGYLYRGVVVPTSAAITSDANIFVIAATAGTYTNFKNSSNVALQVADGEVAILKYNGSWSKEVTGAATAAEVSALGQEVDGVLESFDVIPSRNLFDKTKATPNKYVRKDLGTLETNSSWAASDYIDISSVAVGESVKVMKTVGYGGAIGTAFYNANKVFTHGGTASVAKQEGDVYYRASIPSTELDTAMIYVGDAPGEYIPFGDDYALKDGIITKEKLADGAIVKSISELLTYYGFNRLDPSKYTHGYINKSTGAFVALASGSSDNIQATDFIPVSTKGLHCYCRIPYGVVGDGAVYDADKKYIRALTSDNYSFVEGDAFVRWTASTTYASDIVLERYDGNTITLRSPLPAYQAPQVFNIENAGLTFDKLSVPGLLPADTLAGVKSVSKDEDSMSADTAIELTGYPAYVKNDGIVSFYGKISTFAGVEVGLGKDKNGEGYFVRITDTTAQLGKFLNNTKVMLGTAISHGLTISGFIAVTIIYGGTKFDAIITTASGNYVAEFTPDYEEKSGVPYAYAMTGTALLNVSLSANCKHFKSPVWVLGDSYTTLSPARWPYQLNELGVSGFLLDGDSGADSARMYDELERLFVLGSPKYLIWAIGMNNYYLLQFAEYITNVERLCRIHGTELILTTIPWPTNGSKAEINEFIKQTGHRYIDFYAAVSSDENGTWYSGMNDDGTHPTILGAKALASRVLVDFPEIAMLD